ncbi:signal peptidase I [Spirilliplanes yamanashiensis]|uniref:Signal peptidase I n=1 Tax=Spirilliplanes yamanashiensis TaxID=42233 RepID=A0A8J3Y830_9ACTN|nr:signal peptidase I [Spirilliplanes yamanashiensis]MDP9815333.1 signal peptidase I [Spirilliplanes yamanashiensis]GIJ03588.1 hypothetical protein Sya03_29400 [Spirilliplanes yamanashiensis]
MTTPAATRPAAAERHDPLRAAARAVLTLAVRGRRAEGGPWGEAVLREFDQTTGRWEALRWTAGGVRAALRERRTRAATGAPAVHRPWRAVGLTLALVGVLAVVVRLWVLQFVYIPSGSMQPTLTIGDRVAVEKLSHHAGVDRGDVVLYEQRGRSSVKRVLGLPGDRLECRDGRLLRDGAPVDEPYLTPGTVTECAPVTVPAGALYVLGDHREVSHDSRRDGFVPQDTVFGTALGVAWPLG